MTFRTILILFAFIFTSLQINAQQDLRNNYEILDSLIKINTHLVFQQIEQQNISKAVLTIADHPAKQFIKQYLLEYAKKDGMVFSEDADNQNNSVEIIIKNAGLQYYNYSASDDSLSREFSVLITGNIKHADGKIESLESSELNYKDIIHRDDVPFLTSREHPFSNAPVPAKPTTIWEDVFGPVVAVGTAAIVVLLLFTVRSG